MKNNIIYTAYIIATALVWTGCTDKKTDTTLDNDATLFENISLSLSTKDNDYLINDVGEIKISASVPVPKELTVMIESENASVVIPTSNYIIIPKGAQTVDAKLNCIKKGVAKIKIVSTLINNYEAQEITINVGEETPPPPPTPDIERPDIGILQCNRAVGPNESHDYANLYYIKKIVPGFEYWGFTGTIEYSNRNGAGYVIDGAELRTMIIPYLGQLKGEMVDFGGTFVGEVIEGQPYFKPVLEGTVIDANLDWVGAVDQGNYFLAPCVRNTTNTSNLPDGEHYIVLFMAQEGPESDVGLLPSAPAWIKIKVEGLTLTVLDGAIRIADAETFKVGQKTLN